MATDYDPHPKAPTYNRSVLADLILSGIIPGAYDAYRSACERARDSGWTLGQVNLVLALANPLTVLVTTVVVLALLTSA